MKIDIFNHLFPPGFVAKFTEVAAQHGDMVDRVRRVPLLTDLDARFRLMDEFGAYRQIISLASPPGIVSRRKCSRCVSSMRPSR